MNSEWKVLKISDIAKINLESLKNDHKYKVIEYIDTSSITKNSFSRPDVLDATNAPSRAKRIVRDNDILVSTVRPNLEHHGFIKKAKANLIVSTGFAVIRCYQEMVIPKFIYYLISQKQVTNYLASVAETSTTTYPSIKPSVIANLDIKLPDIQSQKKISHILSTLDDKIELNKKINQTLESIAQAMFKSWFVSKPDEKIMLFGDLIQPRKGKNITKATVVKGDIPVVAGGLEPSCYHNRANTSTPVVTVSASGANAGFVRLYHSPVWSSDSSFIDESITPYVYFCYVFLKINQAALFEKQEGSAQPHIYPSHIMSLAIAVTSENDIKRYEETVKPLFQKLRTIWNENCVLEKIRDLLLPKLLSGEIDVSNLNLEPEND